MNLFGHLLSGSADRRCNEHGIKSGDKLFPLHLFSYLVFDVEEQTDVAKHIWLLPWFLLRDWSQVLFAHEFSWLF
jgi:hypothetical protein